MKNALSITWLTLAASLSTTTAFADQSITSTRQRIEQVQNTLSKGWDSPTVAADIDQILTLLGKDPLLLNLISAEDFSQLVQHASTPQTQTLRKTLSTISTQVTPLDTKLQTIKSSAADTSGLARLNVAQVLLTLGDATSAIALVPDNATLNTLQDPSLVAGWIDLCRLDNRHEQAILLILATLNRNADGAPENTPLLEDLLETYAHVETCPQTKLLLSRNADLNTLENLITTGLPSILVSEDAKKRTGWMTSVYRVTQELPPLGMTYLHVWQEHFKQAHVLAPKNQPPPIVHTRHPQFAVSIATFQSRKNPAASLSYEMLASMEPVLPEGNPYKNLARFQFLQCALRAGEINEDLFSEIINMRAIFGQDVEVAIADILRYWGKRVSPRNHRSRGYVQNVPYLNNIPLTRSLQIHHLETLGRILRTCREANINIAPEVQAEVFTQCFSNAELMTEENFSKVYPEPSDVSPEVALALCNATRKQIRRWWQDPKQAYQAQDKEKTNRSQQDTQLQVSSAMKDLASILSKQIALHPEDYILQMHLGAIQFDHAEYDLAHKLISFETYAEKRDEAFACFAKTSQWTLLQGDISAACNWFSCILGASDLTQVDVASIRSLNQIDLLRAQLDSLPPQKRASATKEIGKWMVTLWAGLRPHARMPFLEAATDLLGEDPSIQFLHERLAVYKDIVKEAQLICDIDGPAEIGSHKPFGVFLKLRHTAALEREASGFSRFIAPQGISPNMRTQVPYRKNFENNIRRAFRRQFNIDSIAWFPTGMPSLPTSDPAWRETPLAYVCLQATDAAVDRLPSVQLDLDFLDQNIPVVIPVLSSAVIVNASLDAQRPFKCTSAELILDDRLLAEEGTITLDANLIGQGVLPDPAQILELPKGWEWKNKITSTRIVRELEAKDDGLEAHSEISGQGTLVWSGQNNADTFTFPTSTQGDIEWRTRRYKDVNQIDCPSTITLSTAATGSKRAQWITLASVILCAIIAVLFIKRYKRRGTQRTEETPMPTAPDNPTPLNTILWLRELNTKHNINTQEDIATIEQSTYGQTDSSVNLAEIIRKWQAQ